MGYQLSYSQRNKLNEDLDGYDIELWNKKGKVVKSEVESIINSIAIICINIILNANICLFKFLNP